jgi:drug/metabolite transporter (DMT)-like permease
VKARNVSRKAVLLFAATSVIWGRSFLFIRVAVEHVPPSAAVSGRTLLRAVVLVVTFAAPAAVHLPAQLLPVTNVLALTVLGVVNPGVAYWLFTCSSMRPGRPPHRSSPT